MTRPEDHLIRFDGGLVDATAFKSRLQASGGIIVVLYASPSPTRSVGVKANSAPARKRHRMINLQ